MPAHERWVAGLAAATLAVAAVALVLARPTEEERTQARAAACLTLTLSVFGGPGFAAALLGETDAFPDEIDAVSGADASPDVTLADIDDAGPAFADPLRDIVAVGVADARGEELSAEQWERYYEALVALRTACDEAGLQDQDGTADREQADDPAVRDMVERMEGGADGAPSESD